jgi:flagellar biosynthesis/type III secretory pathway protein FliH
MTSSAECGAWTPASFDGAARVVAGAERGPQAVPLAVPAAAAAWQPRDLRAAVAPPEPAAPAPPDPAEEAFRRGLAAGLREGGERAGHDLRPVIEALQQLCEHLEASRSEFERERERNLRALALVVAQKLVQREFEADPGLVRDLVGRALDLMPADAAVEARLSPRDLELLRGELERCGATARTAAIHWSGDESLARGSFVLETPLRLVDGRVDHALRSLYERLDA